MGSFQLFGWRLSAKRLVVILLRSAVLEQARFEMVRHSRRFFRRTRRQQSSPCSQPAWIDTVLALWSLVCNAITCRFSSWAAGTRRLPAIFFLSFYATVYFSFAYISLKLIVDDSLLLGALWKAMLSIGIWSYEPSMHYVANFLKFYFFLSAHSRFWYCSIKVLGALKIDLIFLEFRYLR